MGFENSPARRYFDHFRKLRHLTSTSLLSEDLCSLLDRAADHISSSNLEAALNDLSSVRDCIVILSPTIDDDMQRHKDLVEIMILRKQVLEEKKANALLRGEQDEAAKLLNQINSMDGFFSAAISDLEEPEL